MSFITKAINLIFNVLIARIISKESYGLATVYLNFIFMLLLFFPRETLRKTCLKYCPDENEEIENSKFKEACNLIWLFNFGVCVLSIPIGLLFIFFGGDGDSDLSQYVFHIFIYIISALLELVVEPVLIFLNIKIDKQYRLIGMTITNYSRLLSNYLLALKFGLDLWSFTLSRLLSCLIFVGYMLYVALRVYKLPLDIFKPNFSGIRNIISNKEIFEILNTFVKGTSLKMVLNYSERIVLSFFLNISNADKAEYTFIVENFHTFIKYIIEPAEENFYNLINKIKHYKDLRVIPNINDDFSGDFSSNENEILIKLYSTFKKGKDNDKENYSFKLLKLSLKLFFVFGVLLATYMFFIGKDLLIFIFTEKWGTEHAVTILKVYCLYVGCLAVTSVIEAYSNSICSSDKMDLYNRFMIANAILLIFLSFYLARFDITGLVWANIITLFIRFMVSLYLVIGTEIEMQNINSNSGLILQQCIRTSHIFIEMTKFMSKSFLKTPAIISTIICLIFLNIIKDLLKFDDNNKPMLLFSTGVIYSLNCILIFMVEKKGFTEIVRLKSNSIRMSYQQ
jgi:O-antigen/teichoic acid export membrane protein